MANKLTFLFDALSTASVSLIRAVGAVAAFAFAAMVSSILGPADAGVFFVSVTWAFVIAIIARWGRTTVIMVNFAPMAHGWRRSAVPAMLKNILRYSITRVFVLALPVLLAGWLLQTYGIIRPLGIDPVFVFLLALIVTVQQLMSATAKATGRPIFASALEFCFVTIFAIGGYFLMRNIVPASPMQLFEMLYLGGALLSALILFLNVGNQFFRTRPLRSKTTLASSRRARAFATTELTGYLTPFASFLLMPFVLTAHDVGIFNGVLRIASIVQLVNTSIPSVFVPRYAAAYKTRNHGEAARLVRSMKIVMLVTGIGFFLTVAVLGRFALQ